MLNSLLSKIYLLPIILLSLSVHELSHGFAAYKLGDTTAKDMGRLTLNPAAHLDIVGTVAMMFFGFGWAKPVPVNFSRLRYRRLGPILVAIAGPLSNILIALISYVFYALIWFKTGDAHGFFIEYLETAVVLNVTLAAFNLLPIPPLDGSKVVISLLPSRLQYKVYSYEPYIQIVLFILLYIGLLDPVIRGFSYIVMRWLNSIVSGIINFIA